MNKTQFFDSLQYTFEQCLDISRRKNADYAGVAEATDPFANFRVAPAVLSNITVEKGILIRLTDKLKRIDNLLTKDPEVADEALEDTILDAINYLAILKAYRESVDMEDMLKEYATLDVPSDEEAFNEEVLEEPKKSIFTTLFGK